MTYQMGFPLVWNAMEGPFIGEPTRASASLVTQPSVPSISITPSRDTGRPKRRMEKTAEKEQLSAKKNSESNITNQFYSFFTHRHKS